MIWRTFAMHGGGITLSIYATDLPDAERRAKLERPWIGEWVCLGTRGAMQRSTQP